MMNRAKIDSLHFNAPFLLILVGWIAIACLACTRYQAPQVVTASDQTQFSAERAFEHLQQLAGNAQPRPAGSEENRRVAKWISKFLVDLGYQVQSQKSVGIVDAKVRDRSSAKEVSLVNLVASFDLAPNPRRKKLLLVAHYDSVPFGPGASDNGVGVAAMLEVAKMASETNLQRDIVFLFSDGEELGLLGAKAFAESNPLIDEIGLVMNLDARGTLGPSLMFETGPASAQLVPAMANAMRRPFASSLFYEVYQRLPRDTDFSVFKKRGIEGLNFAFIGKARYYHTENDSIDRVSKPSLQHHGENIWDLINEFERAHYDGLFDKLLAEQVDQSNTSDPTFVPPENESSHHDAKRAVYFDLMGYRLFWWRENLTWPLTTAVVAGWLVVLGIRLFKPRTLKLDSSERALAIRTCFSFPGYLSEVLRVLFLAFVAGSLVFGILQLLPLNDRFATTWPPFVGQVQVGLWLSAIATVTAFSLWLQPRSIHLPIYSYRSAQVHLGILVVLAVLAAAYVPGGSYVFLVPIIGMLTTQLMTIFRGKATESGFFVGTCLLVAAASNAVIWFPLEPLFLDAVGFRIPAANAIRIGLISLCLIPASYLATSTCRFRIALAMSVGAVACFVWAFIAVPSV